MVQKPKNTEKTKGEELPTFPMRINRYLALQGHETRRGADALIESGQVFINGKKAVLGDKVNKTDKVELRRTGRGKTYLYFAYYKPKGIITHSPQEGEEDIQKVIGRDDIFPIGRIDKGSHGLIILTNDGRVTERLLSPRYEHEKEYLVRVNEKLASNFATRMAGGVNIEGYHTKPCVVERVNDFVFKIILTEGKKHQIRRMATALGYTTSDLKRTRVGSIRLGNLRAGESRALEGKELERFLKTLGL